MSEIDWDEIGIKRQVAMGHVVKARQLEIERQEVLRRCEELYRQLWELVDAGHGAAADYRRATEGIDWDWDAIRAARERRDRDGR